MKPSRLYLASVLGAGALALHGCATPDHQPLSPTADDARADLELLRSDFNTGKIRALNQAMKLTVPEADKFWPIYREYEKDLGSVGDRKAALVREFFAHHRSGTLTGQYSRELADQWLRNIQDRLDLWRKYHSEISESVSPVRAAQFLQVENQMAIFLDLSIATEMPVVRASPATN